MQISTHITMIALMPDPTQRMIIGPRAILGSEFKTTIYGSKILRSFSLHHRIIAIKVPPKVAMAKPHKVSSKVMPICLQIVPLSISEESILKILDGLLTKKGSIILVCASNSHSPTNATRMII